MEQRRRTAPHLGTLCLEVWKAKYACATQGHTSARKYIIGYVLFNFTFKAGLLRWRGYAFFNWCRSWILRKREKDTENNLQSATVSLQVVIGLCRRKETAALKIKAAVSNGRVDRLLYDGFFSFAVVRQLVPFALILTSNPHRNVTDTRCFDRIMG